MCLAVPSKVVSLGEGDMAEIDVLGVRRDCSVKLTPGVKPGDYVLVHAGFAIQKLTEEQARENLECIREAVDAL